MNPVIAMLIGVVVMMVLVICTRMHAFPSLINFCYPDRCSFRQLPAGWHRQ